MGLLLLDRSQLEVRTEGEALVLYEAGERRGTVPIKLIDRCVIHGAQTRLDSGVLIKLAEAGVTTVLMSPRQHRRVALVLGPLHNDAAVRLAQAERVMNSAWCQQWARALVHAKLARQLRTLHTMRKLRPDARKPLFDAAQTIEPLRDRLAPDASKTPALLGLDTLRGTEGAAARAYFAGLAGVMPPALGFQGRNRRPPRDPVNACLSLAYTMLHTQAVHACMRAGLDPLLGFYHRPAFGRESLASDLIEPLRPAVDLWVWNMLRDRTLREDHFSTHNQACLLGKTGRQTFYTKWEADAPPLQRWLRAQTAQLARHLRGAGQVWLDGAADEMDDEHGT